MLPAMWAACVSNADIRAGLRAEYDKCLQTIARALVNKGLDPQVDALAMARLCASLFDGIKAYTTIYHPEKLDFPTVFRTLKAFGTSGPTMQER